MEALEKYVADFGAPATLVVDNGGEFVGRVFLEYCQKMGIEVHHTTPYHPRGNAITERSHRTIKSILAALCRGQPLQWPRYLMACQQVLNQAVHTSVGCQPYFAFFGRHAPRSLGTHLPSIDGEQDEVAVAQGIIRETHQTMCRKYLSRANEGRRNQAVSEGALVWVRSEVSTPGTCRKLNTRWLGPYRVVEVVRGGSAYVVENLFTGQLVQRAAEKIKPYVGQAQWLCELDERVVVPEEDECVSERLPARVRRPPRRRIEEC